MPRARVLDEPLSEQEFKPFAELPVENKPDSFGYLNGWLVAIDYGN